MTKIEISGSSGFVGENLVNYLGFNFQIIRTSIRYNPNQQIIIQGDVFIHLAGKAHDLKKISKPEVYYQSNFELTKNIYDVFLRSEAKKFIFLSSVKASADSVKKILTEMDIPNPKTLYGISKLMAEEYILKNMPSNKQVYILRPCMIHGKGNKGNLNLLFNFVKKRIPYPLGGFENKRSLLSVDNLCFIINELLVNDNIPSGVYNVADDKPISTNEIISLMANCLGRKPNILRINPTYIITISKIGDKFNLPLNSERLKKLTENYIVDNQKLLQNIGKPLPLSSKEGLLKTINSFLR